MTMQNPQGIFTEKALGRYEMLVQEQYKERKVRATQGTEGHDNHGIGKEDHTFIDTDESQDAEDYTECYDFTTCLRPNGSRYGIAPGKKCRKGTETKALTKEEKTKEGLKRRIQKAISESVRVKVRERALQGRKNAVRDREAFVKANKYPAANEGMRKDIDRIKKEIADLTKDIQREKRRIAKQIADTEIKETRLQRAGRLAATKARAEKVLADLRKEGTKAVKDPLRQQSGVFNKSDWD